MTSVADLRRKPCRTLMRHTISHAGLLVRRWRLTTLFRRQYYGPTGDSTVFEEVMQSLGCSQLYAIVFLRQQIKHGKGRARPCRKRVRKIMMAPSSTKD